MKSETQNWDKLGDFGNLSESPYTKLGLKILENPMTYVPTSEINPPPPLSSILMFIKNSFKLNYKLISSYCNMEIETLHFTKCRRKYNGKHIE